MAQIKNTKIVIGIITLLLILTLSTSVFASVKIYELQQVQYGIVVNGQQYTDQEYPVLNYNGVTYVPLKKVGDLLKSNVKWDESTKQVIISGDVKSDNTTSNGGNKMNYGVTDGYKTVELDGVKYISIYDFINDLPKNITISPSEDLKYMLIKEESIKVATKVIDGKSHIMYEDFKNKIKPILK